MGGFFPPVFNDMAQQCGECNECCRVLEIKEVESKPNEMCQHCDKGCKIYKDRPQGCRDFERSGVVCLELRRKLFGKEDE